MNRVVCQQLLQAGIDAVHPSNVIPQHLTFQSGRLYLDEKVLCESTNRNIKVIGFGKASAAMAEQIEVLMNELIDNGCVVTTYGNTAQCRKIRVLEAGHPTPDENSLKATTKILNTVEQLMPHDLVVTLISGGGSALLEKLPDGISLSDWQLTNQLLLNCGAAINEINIVRKHISLVKGGQLARIINPATTVGLIISDVIGDRLDVIASGPTTPDQSSFADAVKVLNRYQLWKSLPVTVKKHLQQGLQGKIPDTLKPGDKVFHKVNNQIIANNQLALHAMAVTAKTLGWRSIVMGSAYQGKARNVVQQYIVDAVNWLQTHDASMPTAFFFGGETTVEVKGNGKGGRNQEVGLAVLLQLKDQLPYCFFSAGTDGIDGPTDVAGAVASPEIWQKAVERQLLPHEFLETNNSYQFFRETGGHLKTGPTGTNVMDVAGLLLPDPLQLIRFFDN
jgi:glycerate-2-kinase